jgi:hypothetical protein
MPIKFVKKGDSSVQTEFSATWTETGLALGAVGSTTSTNIPVLKTSKPKPMKGVVDEAVGLFKAQKAKQLAEKKPKKTKQVADDIVPVTLTLTNAEPMTFDYGTAVIPESASVAVNYTDPVGVGKTTIEKKGKKKVEKQEPVTKGTTPILKEKACNVGVQAGRTINLGDYNSAKISVMLNMPCAVEELMEVYEFTKLWVDQRMEDIMSTIGQLSSTDETI